MMRRWLPILSIAMSTLSLLIGVGLYFKFDAQAASRRSESCEVFEGQHLQEVKNLRGSYVYLLAKPRDRWDDTRRFVFERSLPELEANAASDADLLGARVPSYCDEPGVGLGEPDPVVPSRPAALSDLGPRPR